MLRNKRNNNYTESENYYYTCEKSATLKKYVKTEPPFLSKSQVDLQPLLRQLAQFFAFF